MTYILQIKIAAVYFRSATSGQAYQFTLEPNIDCAYTNNIFVVELFFFFVTINVNWAHVNHPSHDKIKMS